MVIYSLSGSVYLYVLYVPVLSITKYPSSSNFFKCLNTVVSPIPQVRYVDIIGYQLFVVNTVEKWMCFLLAYGRKPRFNVFNLILQEKCEFEVAK